MSEKNKSTADKTENDIAETSPPSPAEAIRTRPAWAAGVIWTLVTLAGLGWLYQLYLTDPVRYGLLLNEDAMLEYATATCFLVAAAASLWTALRTTGGTRRLMCGVIGLGFFVVGMEEISWGQRILGFETPDAIQGINRQGELTLHNVVSGHLINDAIVVMILIWLVVSAVLWRKGRTEQLERSGWPMASMATAGIFLVVAVMLHWSPRPRFQEGTEAFLGAAILVWTVERMVRYTAGRTRVDWRRSGVVMMGALVLAGGMAYGLQKKYPSWSGWVLNNLAHDYYLPRGQYEQAAEVYRYIEENPKNRVPESYVSHLRALDKLGQHEEKQRVGELALAYYQERIASEASPENLQLLARSYKYLGRPDEAVPLFERASAGFAQAYEQAENDDDRAQVLLAEARMLIWSQGRDAALAKLDQMETLELSPQTDREVGVWRLSIMSAQDD